MAGVVGETADAAFKSAEVTLAGDIVEEIIVGNVTIIIAVIERGAVETSLLSTNLALLGC